MNNASTLIKWPGGKAREIKQIEHLIPEFDRYIEPFFGGGAMFFHLRPRSAIINDVSSDLIDFYTLVKQQDAEFKRLLLAHCALLEGLLSSCSAGYDELNSAYRMITSGARDKAETKLHRIVKKVFGGISGEAIAELRIDEAEYKKQLYTNALDKMLRTVKNEQKAPFSAPDLKENLITGFTGGNYMYFRGVYNAILLGKDMSAGKAYRAANFYFIREYCYGSMFRYNSGGEFNVPYGGMSYNRKDLRAKVEALFSPHTEELLKNAQLHCSDFGEFFETVPLRETDFMFLDPPYDTDFSDYEGKAFGKADQIRLADALKKTKARFILVIKNTDFIYSLYEKNFNILCFDKKYTYNVRSRNERSVEHLIITNLPTN